LVDLFRTIPNRIVKGMPVGSDGRIHTTFTHNPSSLRLSSIDPNLQNIPRGTAKDSLDRWVKEIFVAGPGKVFWERDFSAIEAVLVGYFCGSARYIRLAKLGVHDYLNSYICKEPADLKWSDADLKAFFKDLKARQPLYREVAKRTVHASNYMTTPRKLNLEFPEIFPTVKEAASLQGLYFDLFPEIRAWHKDLCIRVDGSKRRETEEVVEPWTLGVCEARNPFGYKHEFYNVLDWEKIDNEWHWSYGEDAKRLVSFLPQSTAAAIIKQSAKRLYYEYPWVGETLRLLIHDSILGESSDAMVAECLEVSARVMEAPVPELPLDPTWGMGEFLSIGSEAKVGKVWAEMN
jgi:hypothetical protein